MVSTVKVDLSAEIQVNVRCSMCGEVLEMIHPIFHRFNNVVEIQVNPHVCKV